MKKGGGLWAYNNLQAEIDWGFGDPCDGAGWQSHHRRVYGKAPQ